MTFPQAEEEALRTLKQVMEEKLTSTNVEISSVTLIDGKPQFRNYNHEELDAVVARLAGN